MYRGSDGMVVVCGLLLCLKSGGISIQVFLGFSDGFEGIITLAFP
jgi:hypothetical protein